MIPATGLGRRLSLHALLQSRGAWALADQAVVSLGSCVTAIILAGALPLEDFGAFVLILGLLLFLNSLHTSLVTFPLSVRGAAAGDDELQRLTGTSLLFTAGLILPLSAGLIPIAAITPGRGVTLIASASAAMFLWQIQETLRRSMMAHLRHREAIAGDAIRYVGQVTALWLIARRGGLNLDIAILTMAAAAVPAIVVQVSQTRPLMSARARPSMELLRDYWSLGRWVLSSSLVAVVAIQAVPWTLAYTHGPAEVARFGLLSQVMGLTNPIMVGVIGLIVPAVAGVSRRGVDAAARVAFVHSRQAAVLLVPYCAAVLLLPEVFLRLFSMNNPAYMELGTHMRLVVIAYLLFFPSQIVQALLNGLGLTRWAFSAQCAFSGATLLVSVPLAALFGLAGAVWGGVLPPVAYIAASAVMLRRTRSRDAAPAATLPATRAHLPLAARD